MSIDQLLRLTVRVHVGNFNREADLALPARSNLAEILDEVLALTGAPRISRPWQATTAAGQPVDQTLELRETGLDHGGLLTLAPTGSREHPVIRDAAESLVETTSSASVTGLASFAASVGAVALAFWLLGSPLRDSLSSAALLTAAAIACLAVLAWRRETPALAVPAIGLAGAAGFSTVISGVEQEPENLAWALVAGVGMAACALLVTGLLRVTGPRATATLGTVLVLITVAAAALAATHTAAGTAAALVAVALLLLLFAPSTATGLAGLRVPALPSAGQDLKIADRPDPDIDDRAGRAVALYEGILLGAVLGLIPAVLVVTVEGGGYAQGLCAAAAGSVLLHAARHRSRVATWALFSAGVTAILGVVMAAVLGSGHPAQLIPAGMVAAAALSAPLWAERIPRLEPTTLVWLERAESLAIAATIPLAAQLMGVFEAIRGLG